MKDQPGLICISSSAGDPSQTATEMKRTPHNGKKPDKGRIQGSFSSNGCVRFWRRSIAATCALGLATFGMTQVALGAVILIKGSANVQWNDVRGEQLSLITATFTIALSSNQFLITPVILNNTNRHKYQQFIQGSLGSESYDLQLDANSLEVMAAILFPKVIPTHFDFLGNLLRIGYVPKHIIGGHPPSEAFDMRSEAPFYYPEEVKYTVERSATSPQLPALIRALSPPFYYPGVEAFREKRHNPMEGEFARGKTLWEFRVRNWTNTPHGTFPLDFIYSRPIEYEMLLQRKEAKPDVCIAVAEGHTSSIEVSNLPSDLEIRHVQGAVKIRDFRFKEVLGTAPLDYTLTNKFWLPKTDPELGRLAEIARGKLRLDEDDARQLPRQRLATVILMVALLSLPLALLLARRLLVKFRRKSI